MKKIVIALGLLLSVNSITLGQDQTGFQEFIAETFEKKLSNLESTSDVPKFLQSFSRDLSWRDVTVSIDGGVNNPQLQSKSDLERKVNYLASRTGISMSWDIIQYNELTNREKSYVASMNVQVKLFANGELIREGINNVQIVAERTGDSYAIKYLDILQIASQEYLGTCYARITNENDMIFNVDIAYPNGNSYQNFHSKITIQDAGPFKRLRAPNGTPFYWNNESHDVSMEMGAKKIGNANSIENVILILIQKQGEERCSEVIRTALKK